jgi:hypothetical protein
LELRLLGRFQVLRDAREIPRRRRTTRPKRS